MKIIKLSFKNHCNLFYKLQELKKNVLFSWHTGGRGHWTFILEEDSIPHDLYKEIIEEIKMNSLDIELKELDFNSFKTWVSYNFSDHVYFLNAHSWLIPEPKMGFMIGKGGWRIKALKKAFNLSIKLIPVKKIAYGNTRHSGDVINWDLTPCHNCGEEIGGSNSLKNSYYFAKCSNCGAFNYAE